MGKVNQIELSKTHLEAKIIACTAAKSVLADVDKSNMEDELLLLSSCEWQLIALKMILSIYGQIFSIIMTLHVVHMPIKSKQPLMSWYHDNHAGKRDPLATIIMIL